MSNRPKPTALKELQGNAGHRPLNAQEPKPDVGCPEMPKGLRKTAQREWRRITADLLRLGVLTVVDGKALAMYCDAYADWEEAQRECVKEGLWVEEPIVNKDGCVVGYKKKQAPWFNIKIIAMKVMKSYLIEFGLTPASRTKLKIEKPQPTDEVQTREQAMGAADADVDLAGIDTDVVM